MVQAMKTLAILLLASVCAFGQTKAVDPCAGIPHCTTDPEVLKHGCWNCDELAEKYKNIIAPLKCGRYEHVEFDEEGDVIAIPENRHPYHKVPGSDRCVPDMHEVTEKEWQLKIASDEALQREVRDLRLALAAQWQELMKLEKAAITPKHLEYDLNYNSSNCYVSPMPFGCYAKPVAK